MRLKLFIVSLLCTAMAQAQPRVLNVDEFVPKLDSIANYGISVGAYPGCQVVVAQFGKIVVSKGYGYHSDRTRRKVKTTHLYDLASVTKSTATALAVMKLYEEGRLRLDDKASAYLPFLRGTDKEDICIEDLLFHISGLTGWIDFYYSAIDEGSIVPPLTQDFKDDAHPGQIGERTFMSHFKYKKGAISRHQDATHNLHVYKHMWLADCYMDTLKAMVARSKLGDRQYRYSDVGYITLQWVVEAITGQSLSAYVEQNFYAPMGARHTMFLPSRRYKKSEIVPTVQDDWLRSAKEIGGYTQDEMAAYMGGVAGEAGLYSTAEDLARIFQMYLNLGVLDGRRYLKEETVRLFTTSQSDISPRRMGFGKPDPKDQYNRRPLSAYGHGGFTGTDVWVDPENQLIYVYLTNRVSPYPWNENYGKHAIQRLFQNALYDCMK